MQPRKPVNDQGQHHATPLFIEGSLFHNGLTALRLDAHGG